MKLRVTLGVHSSRVQACRSPRVLAGLRLGFGVLRVLGEGLLGFRCLGFRVGATAAPSPGDVNPKRFFGALRF